MSRSARALLLTVLVAAGCVAAYVDLSAYRDHARLLAETRTVVNALDTMLAVTNELSVTQRSAFDGRGSSAQSHVKTLTVRLEQELSRVRSVLGSVASTQVSALGSAITRFAGSDTRVRANLDNNAFYVAADLVLSATVPELRAVTGALAALRAFQTNAMVVESARIWKRVLWTTGVTAGIWVMGIATLFLAGRAQPESPILAPDAASPNAALEATAASSLAVARAGRLSEDLLAQIASGLKAHGMVVWMGAGDALVPLLAYGYRPDTLSLMGSLPKDADNATAAAWRTGNLQVVPAGPGGRSGAVVAPMMSQAGCVGVLSAEVRSGDEALPVTQALMAVMASQITGLVSPRGAAEAVRTDVELPLAANGPSRL